MGLDITAYERITLTDDEITDANVGVTHDRMWVNPNFPGRANDIKHGGVYRIDGFVLRFSAGSYGGYNNWRDMLARMVGHASAEVAWRNPSPGPFMELINFADNEGTIGSDVSRKLADDFEVWQKTADQHPDEYFRRMYALWRRAFETAGCGGAVCFH